MGDVILMTSMVESIAFFNEEAEIDLLVKKGNEGLLSNNPNIKNVYVFDKEGGKFKNILKLLKAFRGNQYDYVFNCHRFLSSGVLTVFSGAKTKVGFNKNPLSWLYTFKAKHEYQKGLHEIERNHRLLKLAFPDIQLKKPKLYPSGSNYAKVEAYGFSDYYVIAPASVWQTKQYPEEKWIELISNLKGQIVLVGAKGDFDLCERIKLASGSNTQNLAGQLSLLESAALIDKAKAVFANDSAPTHLGTAMNTPTHTFFISTDESFGFGPRADVHFMHQTDKALACRPCGIHGKATCPEGHFKCSEFLPKIA